MKFITAIFMSFFVSMSAFAAPSTVELSEETASAMYYLSKCQSEFAQLLTPARYIGRVVKTEDRGGSFSYSYDVFEQSGLTDAVMVGYITMQATPIQNPPLDGPAIKTECSVVYN